VPVRVAKLSDLRDDADNLALVEAGLRKEWGPFALLGFETMDDMLSQAGDLIFIGLVEEPEGFVAKAALQTTLVDAHGDPVLLRDAYRGLLLASPALSQCTTRRAKEAIQPSCCRSPSSAMTTAASASAASCAMPASTCWNERVTYAPHRHSC